MNEKFAGLRDLIQTNHRNICQITAVRDGETVYEDCWNGFAPTDAFNVMSVAKSVFSLLIGIALDKGFIWAGELAKIGRLCVDGGMADTGAAGAAAGGINE